MYGMLPESKPSGRWLNSIDDTLVAYPHNAKLLARRRRKKPLDESSDLPSNGAEEQQDETNIVSRSSFVDQTTTDEVSYDSKLPKQVRLYRNGDRFYKGKNIRISPQRYFSLDGLLSDLTKSVSLPYGVRKLYTPNGGTRIKCMEEIKNGESYVCASFEKFKKLKYGAVKDQDWKTAKKAGPNNDILYGQAMSNSYPAGGKYATAYGKNKGRTEPFPFETRQQADNIPVDSRSLPPKYLSSLSSKPKLIKIIKAGKKPYQSVSLLLNRKSILSYEHLMQDVSEAFGLPNHRNYKISKLYNAKGDEIKGVAEFFRDHDSVMIGATTRNPVTGEEILEMLEEVLPDSSLSRKLRIKQMKENINKADSGIENEDEVSSQETPSVVPAKGRKNNKQKEEDKCTKAIGVKMSGDQNERGNKLVTETKQVESREADAVGVGKLIEKRSTAGKDLSDGSKDLSGVRVKGSRVSGRQAKKKTGLEENNSGDNKVASSSLLALGEEKDAAVTVNIKKNSIIKDEKEKDKKTRTAAKKPVNRDVKRKKQEKHSIGRESEEAPPERKKSEKRKRNVKETESKEKKPEKQKNKSNEMEGTDVFESRVETVTTEGEGDGVIGKDIETQEEQGGEETAEDILAKMLSTTARDEAQREILESLQIEDEVKKSEEIDFMNQESKIDISSDSQLDPPSESKVDPSSESKVDISLDSQVDPSDSKVDISSESKVEPSSESKVDPNSSESKVDPSSESKDLSRDKSGDEKIKDDIRENGQETNVNEGSTQLEDFDKKDEDNSTDDKKLNSSGKRKRENSPPAKDFEFSGKSGQFVIRPRKVCSEKDVLARYRLGEKIGDGNFADVHVGVLLNTGEEFAIKKVDKSKLKGKESMIENEIAILNEIDHPNIVTLYEEFETDHYIYLIMDYVRGGDLFDAIIDSVKFTEADASVMVRDLARALDYLHKMNVVHRDMKPENLLVNLTDDSKMQLKLADFGLAMEVIKPIYTVCGTPTYVAPEILAETGYGLPVDMWALGVITYILLCGFPPFRSLDRNQDELFDLIQSGKYEYIAPYWNNISKTAKDLVDHLLVVDKKQRFTAVQVLEHPWVKGGERNNSVTNLQREVSINLEKNFSRPSSSKR